MSELLGLDSELAEREVDILLALPEGLPCALVLGQPPSNGTGLLHAEIEGEVLLALVELPEVLALLLVGDSQDAGYRLADGVDPGEFSSRTTSNLLDPES